MQHVCLKNKEQQRKWLAICFSWVFEGTESQTQSLSFQSCKFETCYLTALVRSLGMLTSLFLESKNEGRVFKCTIWRVMCNYLDKSKIRILLRGKKIKKSGFLHQIDNFIFYEKTYYLFRKNIHKAENGLLGTCLIMFVNGYYSFMVEIVDIFE